MVSQIKFALCATMSGIRKAAIATIAVLTVFGTSAFAGPMDILGGIPAATDVDFFERASATASWGARVSSFAYQPGIGALPPGLPPEATPDPGQTLFVYLVENIGTGPTPQDPAGTDKSIVSFTIANPEDGLGGPVFIRIVDAAPGVDAADQNDKLVDGARTDPREYNINPQNVDYNWLDQVFPLPPTKVLGVNEFSVVYFVADGTYTERNGLVTGAAMTDVQTILGPIIPEPATALLCIAALGVLVSRRRQSSRA